MSVSSVGRAIIFFFNDTATPEIYTLTLHDALPISLTAPRAVAAAIHRSPRPCGHECISAKTCRIQDRKSTRLNSSHSQISYAVFCLKKKQHRRAVDRGTRLGPDHGARALPCVAPSS